MQTLRSAQHLARLVLVWFALSLGVAIASPVVNPQDLQMVCSGSGGMKLIVGNANANIDLEQDTTLLSMDCPLCATGLAITPELPTLNFTQAVPGNFATLDTAFISTAQFSSAPLPARGPPSFQ
ncbi:MAG TPA: hypothetical protein PKC80_02525 [Burkholderiaceae bacterium]|nr:hypothetical protein [Burkholderiaceae bacterium]